MNELVQIGPISPLRQRLLDDMTPAVRASKTFRRLAASETLNGS